MRKSTINKLQIDALSDPTNASKLRKLLQARKMTDSDFFRRIVDKTVLTPEEIAEIISKSEGLRQCKWCQKYFKNDDDYCSPRCLELYALETLKKK